MKMKLIKFYNYILTLKSNDNNYNNKSQSVYNFFVV